MYYFTFYAYAIPDGLVCEIQRAMKLTHAASRSTTSLKLVPTYVRGQKISSFWWNCLFLQHGEN